MWEGYLYKSMTATSMKKLEVNSNSGTHGSELPRVGEHELPKGGAEAQIKNFAPKEPDGLLASGASHAMRQAEEEYREGIPVRVTLAGEDEKILRQNVQGTILAQEENHKVHSIVLLGALIETLGYTTLCIGAPRSFV